jgi:hypothetical protein
MDKPIAFIVALIVVTGVTYYFWQEYEARLVHVEIDSDTHVEAVNAKPEVVEEKILYPVPEFHYEAKEENEAIVEETFKTTPLPTLNDSDEVIQKALGGFYDAAKLAELFIFTEFIRHTVVSIDNLTAKTLPQRFISIQKPDAGFMVSITGNEKEILLDNNNYERYGRFMDFANTIDNDDLMMVYVRYYPLFQQAYEDLGYPGRYFNDRVIEVIDHLLQTPEIKKPILLTKPKVFYQFADPALEKLSAGQKIMLRIGAGNAAQIKSRLKSLRQLLTTLGTKQ